MPGIAGKAFQKWKDHRPSFDEMHAEDHKRRPRCHLVPAIQSTSFQGKPKNTMLSNLHSYRVLLLNNVVSPVANSENIKYLKVRVKGFEEDDGI